MWGKSTAAIFLGLPLSVLLVGLGALLSHDQARTTLPWLLMFYVVWVGVMALTFLFRSGLRAWLWLGGATLACYALLYGLKASGLVQVGA